MKAKEMLNRAEYMKEHYKDVSPVPTRLKVGDNIKYTNPQGVEFKLKVEGFAEKVEQNGGFIYIFDDAYWYPVTEERIELLESK